MYRFVLLTTLSNTITIRGMRKVSLPSVLQYKRHYLKHDILSGLLVALVSIPSALAFSVIVGMPLVTGLYTTIIGSIVFGLFGHSRRLVVGTNSALAILLASGAALVARVGTPEYTNVIAAMTLLSGLLLAILGLCRFGFLADLVSRPVMIGFLAGVGVQLFITQLPAMLGLKASGGVWNHITDIVSQAGAINGMTATLSLLVLGIVLFSRNSRIPSEIVGILAAVLFAMIFNVGSHGVEFLGSLPSGAPKFLLPTFSIEMLGAILPTVLSIVLVVLVQSSVTARSLANEHDDKTATNHDTLALGLANIVSSLFHGLVVSGSPPRSQLADNLGMRSQLSSVVTGVTLATILAFGGDSLHYLPSAALAAIVCTLGLRLIRFRELRYMWSVRHEEFIIAIVALVGTVILGVQLGMLVAIAASLMERLRRQYRPDDAVLLRDGVLSKWAADRLGGKVGRLSQDTLVYAFGESLFFENINYFVARLRRAIEHAKHPVSYVVIDAGAIDDIDYTAVETLKRLYRELGEDGIAIAFAHVSPGLRSQFDIYGITDIIGARNIYTTLSLALAHEKQASAHEMIKDLKIASDSYVVVGGAVLDMMHLRDTHNVDLVVSRDVYDHFARKRHWREVVLAGSKRILVHEQYNLMKSWMGNSLASLRRDANLIDGIPTVSIDRLINAKRKLARRQDLADLELLRNNAKHRR